MSTAWLAALLVGPPAQAQADCASGRWIHILTAKKKLYRFDPTTLVFSEVGAINCEESFADPFSMAVDRGGTGWMVTNDGRLYRLNTDNARCYKTGFQRMQHGFTTFGMGYTADGGDRETLYVSAGSKLGGVGYQLGRLDTDTLTITPVDAYEIEARAELTGTADGELFGAFEGTPYVIAEINRKNAQLYSESPQPLIQYAPGRSHFAFAFWGGDFWVFAGPPAAYTEVFRYDPDSGMTKKVAKTSLEVVGAGVSTCAPTEFPSENLIMTKDPITEQGSTVGEPVTEQGSTTAPDTPPSTHVVPISEVGTTITEDGTPITEDGTPITLAPPQLVLAGGLDFGTVPAGSRPVCRDLSLVASRDLDGHHWRLSARALGDCASEPVIAIRDGQGSAHYRPLDPPPTFGPLDPDQPLQVCLRVPYCAGEVAPADAALVLTPTAPGHGDRAAQIPITWTVTGRDWLACYGIALGMAGGLSLLALVILGIVRPRRFPAGATIQVAGSPKALARATPMLLTDCPGSSAGFYRDARLGVHADGSINGRTRAAAVVLRAIPRGVVIEARGSLEIYDRRRRRWNPAEQEGGRLEPMPRELYRAGELCFQVEIG